MLLIRGEEPEVAFLRWRVEAADATIGFRAHEDRPERIGPSWNAFRYVLLDAIDAAATAYVAVNNLEPPETQDSEPRAKPIFRLDDWDKFRCPGCGLITSNDTHFESYECRGRLSAPFRVEQHRWGYRVVNRNGLQLADLFHAYWVLPLAIALTGRPLVSFDGALAEEDHQDAAGRPKRSPPQLHVVSDLDLFDFDGQPT